MPIATNFGSICCAVPEDDEEQQLEALRQFKQAQLLHIAAADIARNPAGDESERSLNLAGGGDD